MIRFIPSQASNSYYYSYSVDDSGELKPVISDEDLLFMDIITRDEYYYPEATGFINIGSKYTLKPGSVIIFNWDDSTYKRIEGEYPYVKCVNAWMTSKNMMIG